MNAVRAGGLSNFCETAAVSRKKMSRGVKSFSAARAASGFSRAFIGIAPNTLPLMSSELPSRSSALMVISSLPSVECSFTSQRPRFSKSKPSASNIFIAVGAPGAEYAASRMLEGDRPDRSGRAGDRVIRPVPAWADARRSDTWRWRCRAGSPAPETWAGAFHVDRAVDMGLKHAVRNVGHELRQMGQHAVGGVFFFRVVPAAAVRALVRDVIPQM